jgi:hypothetical protein
VPSGNDSSIIPPPRPETGIFHTLDTRFYKALVFTTLKALLSIDAQNKSLSS